jgi:hypothetical protein
MYVNDLQILRFGSWLIAETTSLLSHSILRMYQLLKELLLINKLGGSVVLQKNYCCSSL